MNNAVVRLFRLRRNEVTPASLLFFYLFLVIGAYMMGQAVGDALFLSEFPRHLPIAMIGTALMIGVLVAIYIRLSTRLRMETLIVGTLLFFSFSFAGFWWLTESHLRWTYLFVYIWVYAAGAMGPMMGWTLANYVLTTREARRIFGFIGAGAILGGTFFSFVTSDLLRHNHLHPQSLLLGIALLLATCGLLVRLLFRSARQRLVEVNEGPAAGHGTPEGFGQSLKLIRGSRYLLLLAGLTAVGCLATCILGYQFKLIAKAAYGSNAAGLAAFFGRFNGYMGLAALVFQLALTGPLLRTFGIRITLLVVPLALMSTSVGVMVVPTLFMGSILRGSHYLLRFSLDKSSMELLYLPVSPGVKSQVKSFIDTFIWRSADGIAGLTLLFFANVMKFNPSQVSMVNLVVLTGWVAAAYGVRREYLNVLRQAIEQRTLDPERTAAQVLDSTTTEVLAQALERGNEQQLLYSMRLFEMDRRTALHPALRGLLRHRSPSVRLAALRMLGDAGDREILSRVEEMLADESFEVRAEALRYLVVHDGRDPLTVLGKDSNIPVYMIQGAMGAYFAQSIDLDSTVAIEMILETMLAQAGPDAARARREAARLLGVVRPPSELHSRLHPLLHDDDPEVVEQALLSAGKIQEREFLPLVIGKLGQPRFIANARASLVLYGKSAVGTLQSYLNDSGVAPAVRRQIPQVLACIPAAESAEALAYSLLQSDPMLRYDVLKALNKLRAIDPALLPADVDYADLVNIELMGYYRSFQVLAAFDSLRRDAPGAGPRQASERLLRRAFRERMEQELELIFRLLALVYPPRDIHNAFVGLTSGRPQLKANALEVLEHLIQPDLYRRLANVLDPEVSTQRRLDVARQFCRTDVSSAADALRIVMLSEDVWMRACAIYTIGGLRMTELAPDLRKIPCSHDALLEETWNWALARLAAVTSP